jgi:hypothetical protein
MMNDWTNDYFSLPDGDTIEVTHYIVKIYSFNNDNRYIRLLDVDLFFVYLHMNLDNIANGI